MEGDGMKLCPNCKKDVVTANFDLHYTHCSRNFALCRLCNETVPVDEQNHMKEKHTRVPCDDCGQNMERWELDGRHKKCCLKRFEVCQFCDMELCFDALQEHVVYCGSRTEKCPMCEKYVLVKERENHMKEYCPKRSVSCLYCGLEFLFDERKEHFRSCVAIRESGPVETAMGETKAYHPNKLHTKEITSNQDEAVLHSPEEHMVLYKCIRCKEHVRANEFKDHWKACIGGQFPSGNETVNESYKCVSSNSAKTEISDFTGFDDGKQETNKRSSTDQLQTSFDDANQETEKWSSTGQLQTSFDDGNQATKKKPSIGQPQAAKYHYELADKKCDAEITLRRVCGYQSDDVHELEEHRKSCGSKNYTLCLCGETVLCEELSDHEEICLRRMRTCKSCDRKYAFSEYKDHVKSCPMSVIPCEFCNKILFRCEHENHACTPGFRMKGENQKLQQSNDLISINQPKIKKSEDCEKEERCQWCHRLFPVNQLKEHAKSCFMQPRECKFCHLSFPVDEFVSHPCHALSRNNRLKSTDQKLQPTGDSGPISVNQTKLELGDHENEERCQWCRRLFLVNQRKEHEKSCVMSPKECQFCYGSFPVDELVSHCCPALPKNNKLKSKGQKLKPTDDRVLSNSLEDRKLFSGNSKFQQNKQVEQSSKQCAEHKYHQEDDVNKYIGNLTGKYLQHVENISCRAEADRPSLHGHKQTSSGARAQSPSHAFNKDHSEELCEFCNLPFKVEEMEEHMITCDAYSVECVTCEACVKFAELEDHKKLCGKKVECQFCKRCYPPNEISKHFWSCPMSPVMCELCKKNFPMGEFDKHLCCEHVSKQNRRKGGNQNLKLSSNKGCEKLPKHSQQKAEAAEIHDQPMEIDEQNIEPQSAFEGNLRAEASTARASKVISYSSGEEGAAGFQLNESCFKCTICGRKKAMKNLSIPVFNRNRTPLCNNCLRNIQQLHPYFLDDVLSHSSSPKDSENASQSAGAVEKKNEYEQEVKSCEFCDMYLPVNAVDAHQDICDKRPHDCQKCGHLLLLCEKEVHDQICNGKKLEGSYSDAQGSSRASTDKKKGAANGRGGERKHCRYCDEIPTSALKTHEKNCGIRFNKCSECGKSVQRRFMKNPCKNGHRETHESVHPPGSASRVSPGCEEEKENKVNEKIQAIGSMGPQECNDCGKKLSCTEVADHPKTCEMRIEQCAFCDTALPHCFKPQHMADECTARNYKPETTNAGHGPRSYRDGQPKKEGTGSGFRSRLLGLLSGKSDSPQESENSNQQYNCSQSPKKFGDTHRRGHGQPSVLNETEQLVQIPCEFCCSLYPADKLIEHESGCRPELFIGSSESGSEATDAPQNRRHVDVGPVNRTGRNDDNFQRNANFRQLQEQQPVGVSRQQDESQSQPGARSHDRRHHGDSDDDNYEDYSETEEKKMENMYYQEERPPYRTRAENNIPPQKNEVFVPFSYVAKADRRDVGSDHLNALSESEQNQRRYQEDRFCQKAENDFKYHHDDKHYISKNPKYTSTEEREYGMKYPSGYQQYKSSTQQGYRETDNSDVVSDKSSNTRFAPKQSESSPLCTSSRGSDDQQRIHLPDSRNVSMKSVPACPNDERSSGSYNQERTYVRGTSDYNNQRRTSGHGNPYPNLETETSYNRNSSNIKGKKSNDQVNPRSQHHDASKKPNSYKTTNRKL